MLGRFPHMGVSGVWPSVCVRVGAVLLPSRCAGDLSLPRVPVSTRCVLAGKEDAGGWLCGLVTRSLCFCLLPCKTGREAAVPVARGTGGHFYPKLSVGLLPSGCCSQCGECSGAFLH